MKTLLLIDANSLIHRAFHALPPLTTKGGKPAQALYGVASILIRIWRDEKPDYAAALFDRPEPTFREAIYKEYKAQRPVTPDALIEQIIEARTLFGKFGPAVFESPGFEADDLIATLAERFGSEAGLRVVILTGDMDTLQLVRDEKVVVRALRTGVSETTLFDRAAVEARYGVPPEAMIDYKALVGDPSDNIKGVPGVGPKTASDLLHRYGSVSELLRRGGEDEKVKAKILPARDTLLRAQELVTLRKDAPVAASSVDVLALHEDEAELIRYLTDLGFETLVRRIQSGAEGKPSARPKKDTAQGRMF